MNPDGTDVKALTKGTDKGNFSYMPVWSRDGKKLLYVTNVGASTSLMVMDADGKKTTKVAESKNTQDVFLMNTYVSATGPGTANGSFMASTRA